MAVEDFDRRKNWWNRVYPILFLVGIIIGTFIFYLIFHLRYPWSPYGVDGNYYNMQIISILVSGRMIPTYEDPPFIFYFFAFLSFLVGNSTIGIKLGVSLLICLMPLPTYFLLEKIFHRPSISLVGCFILVFNPMMIRISGDFLKELGGILFFLCFIYFFLETIYHYQPFWNEGKRVRLDKYIIKNWKVFLIFLNLILSCLAAIQAPIIMMSQNRQEAKDRIRSQHDYQVNLKAELEIRHLHEKVDHLLSHQWDRLVQIQELQLEMLSDLGSKK